MAKIANLLNIAKDKKWPPLELKAKGKKKKTKNDSAKILKYSVQKQLKKEK